MEKFYRKLSKNLKNVDYWVVVVIRIFILFLGKGGMLQTNLSLRH